MTAPAPAQSRRHLDPALAAVLAAVTDRTYSRPEWTWIDRIEARRQALIERTDVLEYVDYGAGAPSDTRTAEQMLTGRPARQTVGRLTKVASKDPKWAGLLFRVIREVRPQRCIEMGAAAGISGSYQAAALHLNGDGGRLVSLEGGAAIADLASGTLQSLGLDAIGEVRVGRFQDTLGPTLADSPADHVFIDGHHDGPATCGYFAQVTDSMGRGVIILDDIDWSPGMQQAWQEVSRAEPVAASIDLGRVGICVIGEAKRPLRCTVNAY